MTQSIVREYQQRWCKSLQVKLQKSEKPETNISSSPGDSWKKTGLQNLMRSNPTSNAQLSPSRHTNFTSHDRQATHKEALKRILEFKHFLKILEKGLFIVPLAKIYLYMSQFRFKNGVLQLELASLQLPVFIDFISVQERLCG